MEDQDPILSGLLHVYADHRRRVQELQRRAEIAEAQTDAIYRCLGTGLVQRAPTRGACEAPQDVTPRSDPTTRSKRHRDDQVKEAEAVKVEMGEETRVPMDNAREEDLHLNQQAERTDNLTEPEFTPLQVRSEMEELFGPSTTTLKRNNSKKAAVSAGSVGDPGHGKPSTKNAKPHKLQEKHPRALGSGTIPVTSVAKDESALAHARQLFAGVGAAVKKETVIEILEGVERHEERSNAGVGLSRSNSGKEELLKPDDEVRRQLGLLNGEGQDPLVQPNGVGAGQRPVVGEEVNCTPADYWAVQF